MSDEASAWLPALILLEDFQGDFHAFLRAVNERWLLDFADPRPAFRGLRMGLKRMPLVDGMDATFWHFVSSGKGERDRIPDLRRCERIGWPMAMIRAADTDAVRTWEEIDPSRGRKVLVALPDFSYLVVVDHRGAYVLPWTAYNVDHEHERRKLRRRYEAARAGES